MSSIIHFTLCILTIVGAVQSEVYTSQSHLESLIFLRREVNRAIEIYVAKEEGRLEYLKERLKSSRGLTPGGGNNGDDDGSGNPINAFLLVKGLTLDLAELVRVSGDRENFNVFGKTIEGLTTITAFPDTEDLSGAALGLIRLQETYQLDTKSIARGAIGDSCCTPELSLEDCFELGRQSYIAKNYDYASEWFTEALLRFPDAEMDQVYPKDLHGTVVPPPSSPRQAAKRPAIKISKSEILNYLHWAEEIKKTLDQGKDFLSTLSREQLDAFVDQVVEAISSGRSDESISQNELNNRYKSLCRGEHPEGMPSSSVNPQLKCYYSTRGNNPYFLVGPIKEELLNLDPLMWSFKDVIHSGELEKLKELAKPILDTAMVVNVRTGMNEPSTSRVSKSAWLTKEDDNVVREIDIRTGLLTGLSMDSAESLQIANYGIGGMYLPHYDFALDGESADFLDEDGNRIATMMFYMSDVEKGGATVFPKLNLTLWPEKGSAVFWYNLKKSGEGDRLKIHAACPVLLGTKWVANKWIHERGQEFRYKCGLQMND